MYTQLRDSYVAHFKQCHRCAYGLRYGTDSQGRYYKLDFYTVWNFCPEAQSLLHALGSLF